MIFPNKYKTLNLKIVTTFTKKTSANEVLAIINVDFFFSSGNISKMCTAIVRSIGIIWKLSYLVPRSVL